MIKKLTNISGAKVLNNLAQKDIKGGGPGLFTCPGGIGCPLLGFCCVRGICVDENPVDGLYPPCE